MALQFAGLANASYSLSPQYRPVLRGAGKGEGQSCNGLFHLQSTSYQTTASTD